MNAGLRRWGLALGALLLGSPPARAFPDRSAGAWVVASYDSSRRIDVNEIDMRLRNDGLYGFDTGTGTADLVFPNGSGKTVLFAGGPWIVAKVAGEWRAALADFASEFSPGAMAGGTFTDPLRPDYRTYKMRRFYGAAGETAHVEVSPVGTVSEPLVHHSWSEYVAGAAPYGAPVKTYRLPLTSTSDPSDSVDVLGPDVLGEQMLWAVYNDANPGRHRLRQGSTLPLGIEVRQMAWAYFPTGPLSRAVFLRLRIANLGNNVLDSLQVGFWSDPDLGGAGDDHIASDSTRDLVYCYNGDDKDQVYGSTPPAIGYTLLRGPITAGAPLGGAYTLTGPLKGEEPQNILETVRWLHGLETNGNSRLDPDGKPSLHWFNGDPVTGTGWLDTLFADRRMMLSTGPVPMTPGDTLEVVVAIVIGQGADNLASVANLRCAVDEVRSFYSSGAPPSLSCPTAAVESCPRNEAFWKQQCQGVGFSPPDLARIAECVDQSSGIFAFTPGMEATQFCAILSDPNSDARAQAYRQWLVFHSNICAAKLGLVTAGYDSVFLGPRIQLWSRMLGATSVAQLARPAPFAGSCFCAESLLVTLSDPSDPAQAALWNSLTGELIAINNGLGVGPTCSRPSGAEPTLIEASATSAGVDLRWDAGAGALVLAAVYRFDGSAWVKRWQGFPTAGEIHFLDPSAFGGRTYHYRIGLNPDGREQFFAEASVDVPALPSLGVLRVRPNPAPDVLRVSFALFSNEPATIDVYDLRGRLVESQPVPVPAPGQREMNLGGPALKAGIYVVHLRQGKRSASAKAVLVR